MLGLDSHGDDYVTFRLGEVERPNPDTLTAVDRLALVYPTWNSSQPAMLLDWLQEMLAAHPFSSVAHLEIATTQGSGKLVNSLQGSWGKRFLGDRVLAACMPDASFGWHSLYTIGRRTRRRRFSKKRPTTSLRGSAGRCRNSPEDG